MIAEKKAKSLRKRYKNNAEEDCLFIETCNATRYPGHVDMLYNHKSKLVNVRKVAEHRDGVKIVFSSFRQYRYCICVSKIMCVFKVRTFQFSIGY